MKYETGKSGVEVMAALGATAVLDREPARRPPMIELVGVEKIYRTERIETVALSQIKLSVPAGEFISIMGPSGSGKSTLLNVIGLLDAPTGGQVKLDGRPIDSRDDRELARLRNRQIGFIFQTFHLIGDLNVLDNVEIPLLYRGLPGATRRRMARTALERVGLAARVHHFPAQLSGGQQQRVAVARAIVGEPGILLADEPTGNLDSRMGDEIMELMHELNRERNTTIVMVTHDQRLAESTGRIIRLFDGRQVA
jgi:putative ABC transport system ATP-binding protein